MAFRVHTSIHFHPVFLLVTARLRNRRSRRIFLSKFLLAIHSRSPRLSHQNERTKVSTSWKQRECIRNVRHVPSFQERSNGNWSRLLARHLTLDIILRNKEYSIGFLNSSPNGYPPNCWNVASGRAGFLNSRSTSLPRSTILPRDAQLTS